MIATNKMDPFLARICTEAKETYDFLKECNCGENEEEKNMIYALLEEAEKLKVNKTEEILSIFGNLEKSRRFFDEYYSSEIGGQGVFFLTVRLVVYRTDGRHMKEIVENLRVEHWH